MSAKQHSYQAELTALKEFTVNNSNKVVLQDENEYQASIYDYEDK